MADYSMYFEMVQQLYIGYYQRPADPEGLLFWASGLASTDTNGDGVLGDGEDFTWVLNQFANSAEAQVLYGDIQADNIAEVVDAIYMGLFNRHAEQEGLDFWVNSFNTGASTPASILWNVMMGAQGLDDQTVDNKVVAASQWTQVLDPELDGRPPFQATFLGTEDNDAVRAWLADVTYNGATIPSVDETATWVQDNIADPGDPILVYNTYTLTPAVDNITITGLSNDLVTGIVDGDSQADSTYTNGDTINGNGLTDMQLVVVDNGTAAAFATVNNVDNINIVAADTGDIDFNAIGWSNIDAINVTNGVDGLGVYVSNLEDGVDLSVASGVSASISVDYAGGSWAYLWAEQDSSVSFIDTNVAADVAANESAYFEFEDWNGGDVTIGTVAATIADSGYLYFSAEGQADVTIGDITVDAAESASLDVWVYGSAQTAGNTMTIGNVTLVGEDAYSASVTIGHSDGAENPGNLTVGDIAMTGFEYADLYVYRSAWDDDILSGNVTVGNVTMTAAQSGWMDAQIENSGYNEVGDLTVGDIDITLAQAASGSLTLENYASYYSAADDVTVGNTTIGNINLDLATDATFDLDISVTAYASAGAATVGDVTIGDITINTGINTSYTGYITISANGDVDSSTVGDVTIGNIAAAIDDGGYYYQWIYDYADNSLGNFTMGNITVDAGVSATIYNSVSLYASYGSIGEVTFGDVSIALGEDSYADSYFFVGASQDIASFTMGDVTLAAAAGADQDTFSVTIESWSGAVGDVAFGDLTVTVGPSATVSSVDYYVSAATEIASVSLGNVSADVAASGYFSGELYLYGNSAADVGAINVGDITLAAATSATAYYSMWAYEFEDIESATVGNVALSAVGDNAYAWHSFTLEGTGGGDIGAVTYGDVSLAADGINAYAGMWVSATNADSVDTMTFGDVTLSIDTAAVSGTAAAPLVYASAYFGVETEGDLVVGDIDLSTDSILSTFGGGNVDLARVWASFSASASGDVTLGDITVSGGDGEIDNFATLTSWLNVTAGGDISIGTIDYSDYGTGAVIDISGYASVEGIIATDDDDTFIDNAGATAFTGGEGADIFRFVDANAGMALGSIDQILDFSNAAGDKIDFTLLNGGAGLIVTELNYDEVTASDFAAFMTAAGASDHDVCVGDVGTDLFVAVDGNSDDTVDFVIQLTGVGSLADIDVASFI